MLPACELQEGRLSPSHGQQTARKGAPSPVARSLACAHLGTCLPGHERQAPAPVPWGATDKHGVARSAKVTNAVARSARVTNAVARDTPANTGRACWTRDHTRTLPGHHPNHTQTCDRELDSGGRETPPSPPGSEPRPGTLLVPVAGVADTQPRRTARRVAAARARLQTQGTPPPRQEGSGRGEVSGGWKSDP